MSADIQLYLLLYDRQQYTTPDTLCRVQAAMVDGSSSMVATAGFVAVSAELPQSIYSSTSTERKASRIQLVLGLFVPYAVFLTFSIWSALVGKQNFQLFNPMNGLYCSLHVDGFSRYGIPAYCTAIMIVLLCLQVAILVKYWQTRAKASRAFTLLKREIPFSLILRMSLFSVASILVFSTGVLFMSDLLTPWPYIVEAALPLLAVCIFGTQKDLVAVWACRRHPKKIPSLQLPDIAIPSAHVHHPSDLVLSASGSMTRFESAPPSAVERVTRNVVLEV
ncbi:hypothetical protein BT96DRAFT_994787 [Gymnopus androsaceus JB14]|uniref:G-protein coupled receptors family 1 profile domain-containing protein n=1 Tax=Gymnopus androsaceus JB14 TaxID=1447944 RepID=A0A6A4HK33_9AGAR|nr:hypothetical protein BT96DRAFT_994787 [Gymnopus androsaceus JB14]